MDDVRPYATQLRWSLAALAAAAALSACAHGRDAGRVVALDPLRLEAVEVDGQRRVEVMDPAVLFREAGRAFEAGDFAAAADRYRLVADRFPESRYADVSRYNAGLALERAGRCPEAEPLYAGVAERLAGSKDAHDALFRLATCQEAGARWEEVEATFTRVLVPEYARILPSDRVEALARRGVARMERGDLARAERDFTAALLLHRRHLDDPALVGNRWVSVAQLRVGELYRELFRGIRFRLPLDRMARDLEDKANLFLKAQNAYLKAVRLQHPELAVVAGYRLGSLYEGFYEDMLAAEIPSDLARDEIEVYYEELKAQIRPLIVQAIDIYERNLRLGERLGGSDEWVRKTEASLARLREILRDETSRDALARIR